MTSVSATVVSDEGRQPATLTVDDASTDGLVVLTVDGVEKKPEDLPKGAYLEVRPAEMADRAALAGFFIQPRQSPGRRWNRFEGRLLGAGLLAGAIGSLLWAVKYALALDLLSVLVWLGLAVFLAFLGLFWWFAGEDEISRRNAQSRSRARRWRSWLGIGRRR